MARRVAVTGMGILSAHGTGLGANVAGMRQGADPIGEVASFDASRYRGRSGGEVRGLAFDAPLRRLRRGRLDRATLLLLAAFEEAVASSGLKTLEMGLVSLGTTLGGMISGMRYHEEGLRKGFDRARRSLLVDYLAHSQAADLKMEYGIKGEAITLSDACASGASAIGHAFSRIRSGSVDVAVAGGYDTMCEFTFAGFNSLQAVTPDKCRPFDKRRDGLVLGEGAGVLILEEMDRALGRGAKVLGEVAGYGAGSDAFHPTRPDPEGGGAARAMSAALADAGVDAREVDYINAHGTGTPYNDAMEARAIRAVFGKRDVPVSSVKSMVGHTLGAAGAIEAITTLFALAEGFLPPNINCGEPDPDCPVNVVTRPALDGSLKTAVSNSFGFGGVNASLVLKRC